MSRKKKCCCYCYDYGHDKDYCRGYYGGYCGGNIGCLDPCKAIIVLLILANTKLLKCSNAITLVLLYWLCCVKTTGLGCCC